MKIASSTAAATMVMTSGETPPPSVMLPESAVVCDEDALMAHLLPRMKISRPISAATATPPMM